MNDENSPIYKPMKPVIDALREELTGQNIPSNAISIKPVVFSGNFSGDHGRKNPPQYGFAITVWNEDYLAAVDQCFSYLKRYPYIRALNHDVGNPVFSGKQEKDFYIGYTAHSMEVLTTALNSCVLSPRNELPVSSRHL